MWDFSFYKGKKILVTGHTGFKGSWLSRMLLNFGAEVIGYSLEPPTEPSLFRLLEFEKDMKHVTGDVRDFKHLKQVFDEERPELVMHLAAQPIVLDAYKYPRETYEINVMGTVNLLECVRQASCVRSVLNVTTDKVYQNNEWYWGYRENDILDGIDPYSNSKSCSELVTHSYNRSFFEEKGIAVSTARAGNVIGGGDFASDRIIPDCVRAMRVSESIKVRNPYSVRPYQHVLEPLTVYLEIVRRQYEDIAYADYYNVGPEDRDCITTGELVDLFCSFWGEDAAWENQAEPDAPHEDKFLKLDCCKIKNTFGWKPVWDVETAVRKTCDFYQTWNRGGELIKIMDGQIREFCKW